MSLYGWERAEIVLPNAEVAPLKKKLREFNNQLHDDVRAEAVRLHKQIGTTSLKKYQERLRELKSETWRKQSDYRRTASRQDMVRECAFAVLDTVLWLAKDAGKAPRQPTVADVERNLPKATNRTSHFPVMDEQGFECASITFNGRTVTWDVEENNHAVETAHGAPLAKVFFAHLNRVRWTRGTGGCGVGNDEYSRDADYAGGGANYTTFSYGPRGERQAIYA